MSERAEGSNADLVALLREEIAARGRITFARFMELAVGHPEHGYYVSGELRTGFAGDFLTNRNNISLSILKGFIETLLGRASGRLSEDVAEVMTCIGVTCVVQIVQSKNGQYKNDRLKEVIADIDPSETGNESPV